MAISASGCSVRKVSSPVSLDALLGSKTGLYLQTEFITQSTMLQIVGGSDRLPAAFAAKLADRIVYGASIREIRQGPSGVSAIYSLENVRYPQADGTVCGIRPQLGPDAALSLDCGSGLGAATHITGAFAFAAVGRALELLLKPTADAAA